MSARDYAVAYIERGWVPVPIAYREKFPSVRDWQSTTLEQAGATLDDMFPDVPLNIGIVLGEASGWLIDVDFDSAVPRSIAHMFLPPTMTFGRTSSPRSHWLYVSRGLKTKRYDAAGVAVETRSNKHQTVFPGSTHQSGEPIEWYDQTLVHHISPEELDKRISDLCLASAFAHSWPAKGGRHEATLGLSGILYKSGIPADRAETIIRAVCIVTDDDEIDDRIRALNDTYKRGENGEDLRAWSVFPAIDMSVQKWLPKNNQIITIELNDTKESVYNQTIDALIAAERIYRIGDALVFMADGKARTVTQSSAHIRMSPPIVFVTKKDDEIKSASVPNWLVNALAHDAAPGRVPEIEVINNVPALDEYGELMPAGYDAKNRIFCVSHNIKIPQVSMDDALSTLIEPFAEFPWAAECDLATFVAAVLTVLLRGTYDGRSPALLLDKNSAGAGASLLANCLGVIATGEPPGVLARREAEEEKKRIDAALLAGDPIIFLDNRQRITGGMMDELLTADRYDIRPLGKTARMSVKFRSLIIITGNNLTTGADTRRRVFKLRLDSPHIKPYMAQNFRIPNLVEHVKENREALVGAALRIAQIWIRDGKPRHGKDELGGFESWSRVVRGVVAHAGLEDPLTNTFDDATFDDEDGDAAEDLVRAVANLNIAVSAADVISWTKLPNHEQTPEQLAVFEAIAAALENGKPPHMWSSTMVGMAFKKYRDKRTAAGTLRWSRGRDKNEWYIESPVC